MQTEFINPNLHVILIHYPLALLGVGILIELFAFLWRRSSFRTAGRWMILIGILSLVPATTSGLYAMQDVTRTADTDYATWAEARAASPVRGHAWEMLEEHAWLNGAGTVVFLLVMVIWLGSSDIWRARLHFPLLFILVVGMAILVAGAWHGGEMIYRDGVAISRPSPVTESPGESEESHETHKVTYYIPPLQMHVILAGLAIAAGVAAIGLSLRPVAPAPPIPDVSPELRDIGAAINPGMRSVGYVEEGAVRPKIVRQPVARFWLLGAILGLAAAATGWWFLAVDADTWQIDKLWAMVADRSDGSRRIAHTIAGVVFVLWMILMALISRVAAGRKFVISFFSLLLVAAVAAQVWLGSLLLFDTNSGPLTKFNASDAAPTSQPTTTASMR